MVSSPEYALKSLEKSSGHTNLSVVGKVETIAYEYLRHPRGVLIHLLEPALYSVKAPLVGDVVDEEDALRAPRVRPQHRAKPTLT